MPASRRAALLCLILAACLAACSGGPPKRVYPPSASVQELSILEGNGGWKLNLRMQNFSNVPHTISAIKAQFLIEGEVAATLDRAPNLIISPQGADIEEFSFSPSISAQTHMAAALADGRSVRYELRGDLESSAPDKRRDSLKFEGQLWPVPGLPGVLR
ncbi:MAG: hypothetical protein R3F10_13055 [Lysobacteraceae bacterium]